MKKGFILAFLVMSLAVSAQTVNPLTIELGDFNLDSLRMLYSAEPTMYCASLEVLEQSVQKQLDAVALVKKEIKAEQNHAKELANSLKVASKMTAAMKKLYSQEEAELKAMQKTVDIVSLLWFSCPKSAMKSRKLTRPDIRRFAILDKKESVVPEGKLRKRAA